MNAKAKAKAKATKPAAKKRRTTGRKSSGFGQAVLVSLRGWERDPRFVKSVRRKIAVARRQLAEGRMLDGESAMAEIIAEAGEIERAGANRRRSPAPRDSRKRRKA